MLHYPPPPTLTAGEEAVEPEVVPGIPASWVPRLSIPRDVYDMRCPKVGARQWPWAARCRWRCCRPAWP
jgi:hypothetical protein